MSNEGKIRVPITDVNGKQTHVWKTPEEIASGLNGGGGNAKPAPSVTSAVSGYATPDTDAIGFSSEGSPANPFEGSSEWASAIDLHAEFSETLPISERAELIADRISESSWYADSKASGDSDGFELDDCLEELREAGAANSPAQFDAAWNSIYNLADNDKVWLATP